jgi:hypothetical protein
VIAGKASCRPNSVAGSVPSWLTSKPGRSFHSHRAGAAGRLGETAGWP